MRTINIKKNSKKLLLLILYNELNFIDTSYINIQALVISLYEILDIYSYKSNKTRSISLESD